MIDADVICMKEIYMIDHIAIPGGYQAVGYCKVARQPISNVRHSDSSCPLFSLRGPKSLDPTLLNVLPLSRWSFTGLSAHRIVVITLF